MQSFFCLGGGDFVFYFFGNTQGASRGETEGKTVMETREKETEKQVICKEGGKDREGDTLYFVKPPPPPPPPLRLLPCQNDMQLRLGLPQVRGHSNYSII